VNSTKDDEQQVLEWAFRWGVPALAWTIVFAFFGFADSVSTREPRDMAHGAPAAPLIAGDCLNPAPR
jgi:hypothetical protein